MRDRAKSWLCRCSEVNEHWRDRCKSCWTAKDDGDVSECVVDGLLRDLEATKRGGIVSV
jgi:hypothetical protein